jgi:CubicO group peptidase (beta-lactamase class C family)
MMVDSFLRSLRSFDGEHLFIPLLSFVLLTAPAAQSSLVTPERLKEAVDQLDQVVEQSMEKTNVPGIAVAVVYHDQLVYAQGFGVREAGKPERVDPDTVFQLASVSKPIAATVIAALVGDRVVSWDDPVIKHDPGFAMCDPWVTRQVTLRDFFCHRSGLPDHAGDWLEDIGYDRAAILYRLRYQQPDSSFRSHYAYTNFGLTEAAVAAAKAAGKSWEDLCQERLYQPLGMQSTSSRHADFLSKENRAHLHVLVNGKWLAKYDRNPDAQSPAGGVSSSVRDVAQWIRLCLGGGKVDGRQVVNEEALPEMFRPQVISRGAPNPATDRVGLYGLGWNVNYTQQGLVSVNHSGGFDLGAATTVMLLPSEQLGIVVLTNTSPIGVPEAIGVTFLDLAQYGKTQKDWSEFFRKIFLASQAATYGTLIDYSKPVTSPTAALPNGVYLGTYNNDFYGPIDLREEENHLVLAVGPEKKLTFPLSHFNRDIFDYQPTGESAYGLAGVFFTIGPDGKASSVTIENLNVYGQGTFTRVNSPQSR